LNSALITLFMYVSQFQLSNNLINFLKTGTKSTGEHFDYTVFSFFKSIKTKCWKGKLLTSERH